MRTAVLTPAAELSLRRCEQDLPGFDEAWETAVSMLASVPERGRRIAGGRWEYRFAERDRPSVRAVYDFDEDEVRISNVEAFRRGRNGNGNPR